MAKELLFITEKSGQHQNVLMTDLHTGTTIKTYKDDSSASHSLCIVKDEFILAAINNKPLIYYWSIENKERARSKLITPGLVSSLAISNDGNFLAASVAEKIYVWQLASGELLCILSQHLQTVQTLKFTDDDGYLCSTGDDNLVMVWELGKIVARKSTNSAIAEPVFILTGHSLPVTDIYCTSGGPSARLVSVSLDQSCKIWDLLTGQCFATLISKQPITCITMDTLEMNLFIGCQNGEIHKIDMHDKPLHRLPSQPSTTVLVGHTQAVQCLQVNVDGSMLVSGGKDGNVITWDIASGQCIRTQAQKGAITNLLVVMTPKVMHSPVSHPTPIMQLKKTLDDDCEDVLHIAGTNLPGSSPEISSDEMMKFFPTTSNDEENRRQAEMQNLRDEMDQLKDVCQKVYEKAVKHIVLKE